MSSRIIWIDITKALGIFLVVLGHVNSKNIVNDWIYSFHMPLFFFLSGLCFTPKKTYMEFFVRKIKSLLLPYIYFGILITFFELYLSSPEFVFKLLSTNLFNYGAMWFIPVLFVSEQLFYPVSKIANKYMYNITLIIFAAIGYFLYRFSINIPLSSCFAALFFYGLGFKAKRRINLLFTKTYFIFVFIVLHWVFLFLSGASHIGMMNNFIPQPLYSYSTAIFGLLSLCAICYVLSQRLNTKIINSLIYIGQNTLIILCFHMTFIGYSVKLIESHIANHWLYKDIEFLFVWLLCIIMIFVIRNYFPWMISQHYKHKN
jgi:fucose 4-O-acetylase-like acetyltransferase